ncbi:hypothetical protein QBC38DRAFT_504774 [Podospora fimiseda]|uniref:NACHT domain-containing protein n=1 Tax=Podospora fimiseda TaxID=252190 RepID=A0AAN6YPJ3_9PEZI|nr:hypothetical protein QBC38DRAFT_504774 [Podospora fimiseda]
MQGDDTDLEIILEKDELDNDVEDESIRLIRRHSFHSRDDVRYERRRRSITNVFQIRYMLKRTSCDRVESEYQRHLALYSKETGSWLYNTSQYQEWHQDNDHGLLYIKGVPGSGKSVLAAALTDQLARENCPILHFFAPEIRPCSNQPLWILRDWLHQLIDRSLPLQQELKPYLHLGTYDKFDKVGMDTLVYLVADGLDETDKDTHQFLQSLASLGSWRPSDVKVLITSRPSSAFQALLEETRNNFLVVELEQHIVDLDIAAFVQDRLAISCSTANDRTLIKEAITSRANGVFLYAKLALNAFLEPTANLQQPLQQLPADLNTIYTNLLLEHRRLSGVSKDLQLLILSWVTHARRSLRLPELAKAITIKAGDASCWDDIETTKDLVKAACGPLLDILPDDTVTVIHHSFTVFLLGSTAAYYGFTPYVDAMISRLDILDINAEDGEEKETPIFYAVLGRHASILRRLVEGGADPDRENVHGTKPIHIAAICNYADVVATLFEAGDNPATFKTGEDLKKIRVVGLISGKGHVETIEALLPFLADHHLVEPALNWAVMSSQYMVLSRLVQEPGLDINAKV